MTDCFSVVDACVFVVSRLADDGTPIASATASYQAGSIIEVTFAETDNQIPAIEVTDACGNLCINVPACSRPALWPVTVEICRFDFRLGEIMTGAELLVAYGGATAGLADPGLDKDCAARVGLEVYQRIVDGSIPGNPAYLRHVFPMLPLFRQDGARSLKKGETLRKYASESYANPNYGTGPHDDLDPPMPANSGHAEYFAATLPTITCGYTLVPA